MSPVAPPSPQEIHRKLSMHASGRTPKPTLTTVTNAILSGTESDSDSLLTPDVSSMSPGSIPSAAAGSVTSPVAQPLLSSIAERPDGGDDDSDEDDDDEEGGWKTGSARRPAAEGSRESVVLKAGYLWKKGERRKTWKKRWFVLRPAHIAYYKTAAEYQLLRLLDLSDVHSCTSVALKKHENTFGLVSPIRTFYLQAKTAKEVQEWVIAIEKARQTLAATATQTGAGASVPIPIPTSSGRRSSSQPPPPVTPPPPPSFMNASSDSEDASPSTQNFSIPLSSSPSKQRGGAPSSGDPSKVVVSGYLMKCGSKRRNWRKRWFVLTGERLWYSASHMDTKPHRQFNLTEILDALEYDAPQLPHPPSSPTTLPASDPSESHGSHTFKIITAKRPLLLCAPGEEDEIKWLGAIRALIARRSGAPIIPGTAVAVSHGFHPSPIAAETSPSSSGFASGGSTVLKGRTRGLSASGGAIPEEGKTA